LQSIQVPIPISSPSINMSKIILLLGAGKMVGEGIASSFHKAGYKVALASRSGAFPWDTKNAHLHVKADFANPSSIQGVFDEVKAKLGVPNVVVYNSKLSLSLPKKA
jgi:NAD(P)-dependent dehydrogenase (short-subunit alcohol dehydrogenase family)